MININKQKFLTELSKLLTFMYDEDRQTALSMYGKMFDDADNEQALMQLLVSPTRQAVVLARAYNAKERKLQVHAQPRSILEGEEPDVLPEFILAIDQIQQEAAELFNEAPAVLADQISLFADGAQPQAEIYPQPQAPEVRTAPPVREEAPAPAREEAPAPVSEEPKPQPRKKTAVNMSLAESSSEIAERESSEAAVRAFMEEFTIKDDTLFPEDEEDTEEPLPETEELIAAEEPAQPVHAGVPIPTFSTGGEKLRKANTPLLILYIILAIPLTLLGVALLLVPALLCLALAAAALTGGAVILSAAFSGFAVFADIMVVLGGALVVLALGLLLLWAFVWFIGGAIVSFVNAVVRLGGSWCYKEVAAE